MDNTENVKFEEWQLISSMDNTLQPALFHRAASAEKRPLLVGLHTWSYDRYNQRDNLLPVAEKYDFHLLLPEFRGPNLVSNPDRLKACGSEFVVRDIIDTIEYAKTQCAVDQSNIFLLGASGGGQAALLTAAFYPEIFKAVGAFVPVCDLKKWSEYSEYYGKQVRACCGDSEEEMQKRSPCNYAAQLTKVNLKIFHGKYDRVVPVEQSIKLYFKMMEIDPKSRTFFEIFDGGHEMNVDSAIAWFLSQYNKKELTNVTG